LKVRVIQATVKDDSDYDFIYDNAVQNTLKDYWTWAETSKGTVCFEKNYEDIGYSLTLCVDAKFDEPEDYALFKLLHGGNPLNKLVVDNKLEGHFEYDNRSRKKTGI